MVEHFRICPRPIKICRVNADDDMIISLPSLISISKMLRISIKKYLF